MKSFTEYVVTQRSPEWYAARLGCLTGSCAGDIVAKIKSGEAASRRNLRLRLVLERLTGRSQERDVQTAAMEVGIEREPLARAAFEAATGLMVQGSGFLRHADFMAGCSLDGHTGDVEGLLSIKCRQPAAHLEFLRTGKIPADALAQMQHELWITGAATHTYFSWNPDFPDDMQGRLVTLTREQARVEDYVSEAVRFLRECDDEVSALRTMSNPAAVLKEALA